MLKVMIADDDYDARHGLLNLIRWDELDAEVVYVASNGKQILDALEKEMADLIISDIKMPIMDGIEMAKQIRKNMPNVQVILISAYAEFEYAREAMGFGVKDYILKPISRAKIIKLSNIVRKIAEEVEFTKTLPEKMKRDFLHLNLKEILEKQDYEAFVIMTEVPDNYCNLIVYREFCVMIAETLAEITSAGKQDIFENEKILLRKELNSCSTCKELQEILLKIFEKYEKLYLSEEARGSNLVSEVQEYIVNRISDPNLNVQAVANNFELSAKHLSRVFKSQTEMLLSEYIANLRLDHAKYLLEHTELNVAQIAQQCGYIDTQYFFRLFKNKTELTPAQFRQKVRQ